MTKFISLDVLENDANDPMDDLFAFYEHLKLKCLESDEDISNIKRLETILTTLDRKLQDLEEKNSESSNFAAKESKKILHIWSKALLGTEKKEDLITSVYNNALQLTSVITHASKHDNIEKAKEYMQDFLNREERIKNFSVDNKIEINSLFQLAFDTESSNQLKKIEGFLHKNINSAINNYEIKKGGLDSKYATDFEIYRDCIIDETWNIELTLKDSENPENIFFFLWTFIESLKKIEGVEVQLEDIKQGSIIAKIKIKFNNLLAKEEAKQILENSVKSAEAFAEQKHTEVEKTKSETKKIDAEAELTDQQTKRLPDEKILDERERLKNEKMKADIKSANLDNTKKQIGIIKDLADLNGMGIAQVDQLRIDINGLLYLDKNGEKIQTGADIQEISEKKEK